VEAAQGWDRERGGAGCGGQQRVGEQHVGQAWWPGPGTARLGPLAAYLSVGRAGKNDEPEERR
jgi:hypothetical protein